MKKLRTISIFLLIVLVTCFCFTSCKDKNSKSYTETFKEEHNQELVDVVSSMLLLGGQQFSNEAITGLVNEIYRDKKVDVLGKELFESAGFTSKKISELLVSINGLIQSIIYCKNILADYEFDTSALYIENIPIQDMETIYDPLAYAMQMVGLLKINASKVIDFIDDNAICIHAILTKDENNADLTALASCIEKIVEAYNNFSNALNGKTYAKLIVQAILNKENLGLIFNRLNQEQKASVNNAYNFLIEKNLDKNNVRQAYITLLSPYVSLPNVNTFFEKVTPTDIIKNIGLYGGYMVEGSKTEQAKKLVELMVFVNSVINGFGLNIQAETLSEDEVQELISAGEVIDKNGLGIKLKRYLPFINYSSDFMGRMLEVLDLTEILGIVSKTQTSSYFGDYTYYDIIRIVINNLKSEYLENGVIGSANLQDASNIFKVIVDKPDEGILILTGFICNQITKAKNDYTKNEAFENAIDKAMVDGGVFTSTFFDSVNSIAGEYVKEMDGIDNTNPDFEKMLTSYNAIKTNNILPLVNMKSGLENAIKEWGAYIEPILQLFITNNGGIV